MVQPEQPREGARPHTPYNLSELCRTKITERLFFFLPTQLRLAWVPIGAPEMCAPLAPCQMQGTLLPPVQPLPAETFSHLH